MRQVLMALVVMTVAYLAAPVRAGVLSDGGGAVARIPGASILLDERGTLGVADVTATSSRFQPAASYPAVAESNTPRTYWLRLSLRRGDSNDAWALRWSYKVTQVDVYVPDRSGYVHVGGGFDRAAADGTLVPGLLPLPETALTGTPLYVRIVSVVDPRAVTLTPVARALPTALERRVIFGFFAGFFIAIGAFNLLMYGSLRDRALVNFAFVMFLGALRASIAFGVWWHVLPPITFLQRELIFDTVALAMGFALAAFSIDFLKLRARDPAAFAVVAVATIATLSIYITDVFPNTTVAFDWTVIVSLAFYAALLYAGVRAYRLGMRVARIYAAGIICSMAGYLVNMSSYALPHQELWVYALEAGECLQAMLLGLAVAQSVQESRAEHERLLLESRALEQLAMRDGLTSVLNRRAFETALRDAAENAAQLRSSLGILMIDIDHFKEYNDTLGHRAGDDALREVARACGSCVRTGDVFARYGGEEFAAIVPDATAEELHAIAGRMRDAVIALARMRADGNPLTISIGGASDLVRSPDAIDAIVRQADASLYLAKARGRNQIALDHASVSPL